MIRKTLFLFYCLIGVLFANEVVAATAWSNIHSVIVIGNGYTTVSGTQNIWLATTPEPGLENTYINDAKQHDTLLFGLALEKTFTASLKNIESTIGIEMDYLRNRSMTGVVHPMVNVDPDFDTLNYAYRMKSYLLLATAKLSILNIFPYLGAYFQVGAGGAINKLSDYTETSPAGSSAAPMLEPFGNASHTRFAYSLGAGILCQVSKSAQILIGYRYVNSGLAGFKTSPIQQTDTKITLSPLTHHLFTVSLIV